MPKVYIAAAFRMFSDRNDKSKAYGKLSSSEHVKRLEKIENVFFEYGFSSCLPHRDEGRWGEEYFEPGPLSALCLRHVETSDVIFAIAEGGRGVHIELGFAAAFPEKKLILMFKEDAEPSTLIWGLTNDFSPWNINSEKDGRLIIQSYSSDNDLLEKLNTILKSHFNYKPVKSPNPKRILGTVDIGSHTLKFRIFSYSRGSIANLIHKENHSQAIVDDVLESGRFSENTINTLINNLSRWKEKCNDLKCEKIVLTGTAALRKAENTKQLIESVKKELNLDIDIIDSNKELKYLYSAVLKTFETNEKLGVLGLGGGSIQIGIGTKKKLDHKYLIDFGTNLITKNWVWEKPFTEKEYNKIIKFVEENFKRNIPTTKEKIGDIIYTGGEMEFMLKCQLPLSVSRKSSIHVSQIDLPSFTKFCYQFANLHPQEVFDKFNLDPKWAMGAIAANTIALVAARFFNVKNIIPSNFNISDGVLLSIK